MCLLQEKKCLKCITKMKLNEKQIEVDGTDVIYDFMNFFNSPDSVA